MRTLNICHMSLLSKDSFAFVPQGIFLFGLVQYTGLTYEKTYRFPVWADVLGWLMAGLMMACVPVVAVKTLLETKGTMSEVSHHLTLESIQYIYVQYYAFMLGRTSDQPMKLRISVWRRKQVITHRVSIFLQRWLQFSLLY